MNDSTTPIPSLIYARRGWAMTLITSPVWVAGMLGGIVFAALSYGFWAGVEAWQEAIDVD